MFFIIFYILNLLLVVLRIDLLSSFVIFRLWLILLLLATIHRLSIYIFMIFFLFNFGFGLNIGIFLRIEVEVLTNIDAIILKLILQFSLSEIIHVWIW